MKTMKTIAKIAGVAVLAEVMYAAGKGHVIAYAKRKNPEMGEGLYEDMEWCAENRNAYERPFARLTLKWSDFLEEVMEVVDVK